MLSELETCESSSFQRAQGRASILRELNDLPVDVDRALQRFEENDEQETHRTEREKEHARHII